MKYKVKVTVIDKKLYHELQEAYCTDPQSGACPCYNVSVMSLFFAVTRFVTASGRWV